MWFPGAPRGHQLWVWSRQPMFDKLNGWSGVSVIMIFEELPVFKGVQYFFFLYSPCIFRDRMFTKIKERQWLNLHNEKKLVLLSLCYLNSLEKQTDCLIAYVLSDNYHRLIAGDTLNYQKVNVFSFALLNRLLILSCIDIGIES